MSVEVFGRDEELRALARFADGLPGCPGAMVVAGAAGAGKSTLLRAGAALAAERGVRILQTVPARSEVRLAFTGLGDLVEPCLHEVIAELPAPQARTLRVALLLEEAPQPPPEARAIAVGFRSALIALARSAPVLLVIDDVQWLDAASEAAVGFAVRRLAREPVGLLCAQRTAGLGGDLPLELSHAMIKASLLPVGGLSLVALHRMLRTRLGTSFSRPVLRRIEAGSGGNPFIALEIGRALVRRGGTVDPAGELPVPETLSELAGERLGALAPEVIDVLRLVAVMPGAPGERYLAAGADGAALDAAVTAGVLEQASGQLQFAHPLLAAAVSGATPPGRKRELHAAAAGVARLPEEKARHRALAAPGPSLLVADEIARAAAAAAARGAPATAAELFGLAASLTPGDDEPQARRRRLQRARQLALAGGTAEAVAELDQLAESSPPGTERADALSQLGLLHEHDYPKAISLMERALAEAGEDAARAADIRVSLTDMYSISGNQSQALAVAQRALADAERSGDLALTCAALAQNFEQSFTHHAITDERLLQCALALEPATGGLALRTPPSYTAGFYYACTGRLDLAEDSFRRLQTRAEAEGVEYWRAHVLRHLAFIAGLRGHARRASEIAAEGLEVAEQLDLPHTTCMLLYASAWTALQLGQADTVRELTERGLKLAEQTGDHIHAVLHKALPASLHLALGAPAAAAAQFRPLTGQLRAAGLRPTLPGIIADAAEALIAAGDPDAATALMAERLPATVDPITPALLARCRAMLPAARADPATAAAECGTALRMLERVSPMPLERGRTLYALGRLQRRLKQRASARATLTEVLNIFDMIPAPLWAAQVRAELARISGRSPGPATLTATEQRVATLVARGMTNREVAAELFVSVRAVESTLTKAYVKLGVRSRTELMAHIPTVFHNP